MVSLVIENNPYKGVILLLTDELICVISGPKLFKKPSAKSNRQVVNQAISHCCLAGTVNNDMKNKVLEVSVQNRLPGSIITVPLFMCGQILMQAWVINICCSSCVKSDVADVHCVAYNEILNNQLFFLVWEAHSQLTYVNYFYCVIQQILFVILFFFYLRLFLFLAKKRSLCAPKEKLLNL